MPLFVSSFLVLFLETALIRWMPAYVRLLAYFSNFILLASFLGIGVGCLLATRRRNLFVWFPLIQFAVILAVDRLRLEVALPSTSTIYFSSGTASPVVPFESTLLLPLLFVSVAALFAAVAHRMGRELSGRPPLRAYVINLLGSLAGVAAFALISWLELPPSVWFGAATLAALPFVIQDRRFVAVDIDPVILRLGAERHPDRPYSDPRVTVVCDDARHFLRTTTKQYDLVVFALIDSLTVQSSFAGVRLESYMFTKESFDAVRQRLSPRGVMVLYNYFREKWLVDRLANTDAAVFGRDPLGHVHQDRAYLGVMLSGPRLAELAAPPPLPADVLAYGQPHAPSPAHPLMRDPSVRPATD